MSHTPGPWTYQFETISDDWGEIRAAERRLVAKCAFGQWSEDELSAHRRAKTDPAADNARLIAAAPCLLDALESIIDDMGDDGLSTCEHNKRKALDAYEKATGRRVPE